MDSGTAALSAGNEWTRELPRRAPTPLGRVDPTAWERAEIARCLEVLAGDHGRELWMLPRGLVRHPADEVVMMGLIQWA